MPKSADVVAEPWFSMLYHLLSEVHLGDGLKRFLHVITFTGKAVSEVPSGKAVLSSLYNFVVVAESCSEIPTQTLTDVGTAEGRPKVPGIERMQYEM